MEQGPLLQEGQVKGKYKLRRHLAAHSGDLTTGQSAQGEEHRTGPSHTSSGPGMLVGREHSEEHGIRNHSRFLRLKGGFFKRHRWNSTKLIYKQ